MNRRLVDSSSLRSPELERYLRASRQNVALLSEVTAFESYKNRNLDTIGRNFAICARFPEQIEILRCTSEIIALEAAGPVPATRYIEPEQTREFGRFCSLLERAISGDAFLRRQIEDHAAAAVNRVAAVRSGCAQFAKGIRLVVRELDADGLRALRKDLHTSETLGVVWQGMMWLAGETFVKLYPEKDRLPELQNALQTFAFRFSTASYLLAVSWIKNGGLDSVNDARLVNDLLDMQQVAVATRFDGILTADSHMNEVYEEALVFLSAFEEDSKVYTAIGRTGFGNPAERTRVGPSELDDAGDTDKVSLPETFASVLPSVVALGSLAIPKSLRYESTSRIPEVLGTGFVVDARGIIMTAGHVARSLEALPRHPITGEHAAVAIVFREPERVGDGLELRPLWVRVLTYSFLETFTTYGEAFYGEKLPDVAFVQLGVRDLPALSFRADPNAIRTGMSVAFAGFPLGSHGLMLRIEDQEAILVQMMPFLRHGIISSVHPFPCPQPHGFTIDVMSHGGASGSPLFAYEDSAVLGMLYAAIEGEPRQTYALPAHLLKWATQKALSDWTLKTDGLPTIAEYRASGAFPEGWVIRPMTDPADL